MNYKEKMTEIVGGGAAGGQGDDGEDGAVSKGVDGNSKALFREYFMKQLLDIELSSMGGGGVTDDDDDQLAVRSGPRMSEFSRRSKYIKSTTSRSQTPSKSPDGHQPANFLKGTKKGKKKRPVNQDPRKALVNDKDLKNYMQDMRLKGDIDPQVLALQNNNMEMDDFSRTHSAMNNNFFDTLRN